MNCLYVSSLLLRLFVRFRNLLASLVFRYDWFWLTGLIHDLGKIMVLFRNEVGMCMHAACLSFRSSFVSLIRLGASYWPTLSLSPHFRFRTFRPLPLGLQPQWAVVGDTNPVGCAFSDKIVFPEFFKVRSETRYARVTHALRTRYALALSCIAACQRQRRLRFLACKPHSRLLCVALLARSFGRTLRARN